ncbi:putative RNA-directed DNA polymerase from transposon BS [Stylophora pistillata]|uniref:Putative RNA-directed DNA polymerase from transposon BS n=1 Tax=Stylophora pistillata TaxID=50429 RepID=A0A2B4RNU5_STYPI|nr:putative RNA-directed DNA polymerase from transposon BS [Stylophora pistillata]
MKSRDRWRKIARRTNNPDAWAAYRNLRKDVNREIRSPERAYASDHITSDPNNSGQFWMIIPSFIPRKSASERSFSKDNWTVANHFNPFFTSVGRVADDKINSLANECNFDLSAPAFDPGISPVTDQFNFKHVDCDEVAQIVRSMPPNKSSGIDNIPVRVIKDSLPAILSVLSSLINASFSRGKFPRSWKLSVVSPIPKEGNHEEPNNNRPISLLPILSKVCERAALNQIMPFLVLNERLSTRQSGNKKLHTTETSFIRTIDAILSAIDEKKITAVVLLDMSKAFDTINHGILLNKLLDIGTSPSSVAWLSYEHVNLTPYSVMRVNLAAQVLTASVAAVLKTFGPPGTAATAKLCEVIDGFFDCLNVRSMTEHQRKRKPFLAPYTSVNDERFAWLTEFLDYLRTWKENVDNRPVWVRILVLINSINTTLSWEKRLRRYPAPNGRHVLGKSYSKLRSQKLHRRVLEHIMKDDKYKEEIHLDLRSVYLRSEYPLQIHIDKGNRAVSGRFFNLHNHKPTFKLLAEDQETVLLTGGSLTAPYVMDQFHFHVYCTRAEAEQHTLDGSQFLLHLVFFRKKYKKYNKAVHRFQDGLVAIAIPLEVKEEGYETKNPQMGKFASLVDYISRNESKTLL